jgi:V8-like Glu-specific endopeptidase
MHHVLDSAHEPFNAIGLIQMVWDDGNTYFGSGALISPREVLTCAHNFINQDNQPKAEALSAAFFPGWNAHPLPNQGGIAATCALVPGPYPRINDEWDIAILRLNAPVQVAHRFALTVTKSKDLEGVTARVTGFPQDDGDNDGLMFDDDDEIVIVDLPTNTVLFTNATLSGSSGSPIWTQGEDFYHVYAVHNSVHGQDLRRGTLITPSVLSFLQAALSHPCGNRFVELIGRGE